MSTQDGAKPKAGQLEGQTCKHKKVVYPCKVQLVLLDVWVLE
jgi:hypothetical protein